MSTTIVSELISNITGLILTAMFMVFVAWTFKNM